MGGRNILQRVVAIVQPQKADNEDGLRNIGWLLMMWVARILMVELGFFVAIRALVSRPKFLRNWAGVVYREDDGTDARVE